MGYNACAAAIDFIESKIGRQVVVDPFCGHGSILKIANQKGFDSVGVDILEEQCKIAKL